ncbi:hypothetical protein CLTEP_04890 [Clostridium tepidiprofundi DSM 19306]|uniref:Uncharacterized protein n=1 Tax=Clostridium tepidiprofundi DSM 19306 TaxID=1121338 RepID=A0A151B6Z0_9CLOT|nr:hypothetical protein [Clostridium tepidiprofundi]KYH35550.1 hypothetical protein CLTEP_04890 [Clostridium tepidiprofundi DSM 19306]
MANESILESEAIFMGGYKMKKSILVLTSFFVIFSLIGCSSTNSINKIDNTKTVILKDKSDNDSSTISNKDKNSDYLSEGSVTGGEVTDGRKLTEIRWAVHDDYERILLEFGNDKVVPCFIVQYNKYPYSFVFQLNGTREFSADFPNITNSNLISKFYHIVTCDDCTRRFGVILKKPVEFKVHEYKDPARIVVNIRKTNKNAKDLTKVYSLRTESYEDLSEKICHIEEDLMYDEEGKEESKNVRILIDQHDKYFVEEGYYNTREEAEKRKKELEQKSKDYKLIIKEVTVDENN